MTRKLFYTQAARDDLEEIFWFIAADNPRRARSYIAEIEACCQKLCDAPGIGVARPDLRPGLRVFPFRRRIIIAYELPQGRLDILRIFSSGRDYETIMAQE